MQAARIDQRLRAWELARDSARLGARIRTIHHLTGLRPRDLLYMLFSTHTPPPRGRAPDTREWYHNANLLYRIEASIVIANFHRLYRLGFHATEALIAAYRYYQSVYPPPSRISFDRAFDLAANTEGIWIAKVPSFELVLCPRCNSEFLDTPASSGTLARHCPFCQLLERHGKDPRLTAAFADAPPVTEDIIVHLAPVPDARTVGSGDTPVNSLPILQAKP